ncbi:MAG: response regulator transcription factor [Deltaproteobacteria bacterium]|nr:response regulator transcription factor [Deltaproteobacteria bacterium]MBI3389454.1 response regulator transcription factor [Deltaproteobacteria bacterium]
MKVTVVIADDHAIVRQGIASLLSTNPDIQILAEARDGKEALRLVQRLRPKVALLDISMPSMNGLTAAMRIPKLSPHTAVVMLSMFADRELVLQALEAGARGYLTKQSIGSDVAQAILAVARGDTYLSPDVASLVVSDYLSAVRTRPDRAPELTLREREVLQLIAEGRTNKEIAQLLETSIKTVDTHRTHIMKRLNIHDLAGLVKYAVRNGLIQP